MICQEPEMTTKRTKQLVRQMPWLDSAASIMQKVFAPALGEHSPQSVKDALVGTWLGHPLHPMVVQLPIGFWTSATLLDLLHLDEAADLLIGAGVITSGGAMITGAAQWMDATNDETPRRLGALHGAVNSLGIGLFIASLAARRAGNRRRGVVLSMMGMGAVSAGGLLGGELAYELGLGVNRNAFDAQISKWSDTLPAHDLVTGKPRRVDVGGTSILLVRHDDGIHAVGAICPHLGAPLDEGEFDGETVICPWHGSTFCLTDGSLLHGPATSPLPLYETRVKAGTIQIRVRKTTEKQ